MLTSRKRTTLSAAGLATAMTLSLCLLSGCNGARFLMGGDPQAATPNTTTPVSNAGTPVTSGVVMNLKASLGGKALEGDLSATVINPVTGAVIAPSTPVIAAGGGNYQIRALGNGNIQITIPLPTGSTPASLLPVQILLQSSSPTGKLNISTTTIINPSEKTVDTDVNEYTNVASQYAASLFKLTEAVDDGQKANVLASLAANLKSLSKEFEVKMSAEKAFALAQATDSTGKTDPAKLTETVKSTGLESTVNLTVNAGIKTVADKANQVKLANLSNNSALDFTSSGLSVTMKDGKLIIANSVTGETTEVSLPDTTTPTTDKGNDDTGIKEDTSIDANGNVVSSSSLFNPTVTLAASSSNPKLSIQVKQPGNTQDINVICARVPIAKATLYGVGNAVTTTSPDVAGLSTGTVTFVDAAKGPAKTVEFVTGSGALSSFNAVFNGVNKSLDTPLWTGFLQLQGTSTKVAKFAVFKDTNYYYLVTKYNLTDSVTLNTGHTTDVTTNSVQIQAGTKAEISMYSRGGEYVVSTKTL